MLCVILDVISPWLVKVKAMTQMKYYVKINMVAEQASSKVTEEPVWKKDKHLLG